MKRNLKWYIKAVFVICREYINSTKKLNSYKNELKKIDKNLKNIKSYKARRDLYEDDYLKYTKLIEVCIWERKDTFNYYKDLIFKRVS